MVNQDPVALVTGSASGIGSATLHRAAQLGYILLGKETRSWTESRTRLRSVVVLDEYRR